MNPIAGSMILCTNCRRPYPEQETPYRCMVCGGLYDFVGHIRYDPEQVESGLPGIWRFRHTFGLPAKAPVVTLGEGDTPLVWTRVEGRHVAFKCEYLNPTGSFKDRGSAVLASFLRSRGVVSIVEDSSGNAGASLAAYAARSGMQARLFIPDSASGPKRAQMDAYGAEVVRILGPRSNAAQAVRRVADQGAVYASHAYMPFNLPGYVTLAYELFNQLPGAPGTVIAPVGQGGLLIGIGRGFAALQQAGLVEQLPKLVGVQARACAPLWALSTYGPAGLSWVGEEQTLAEGIRVKYPLRGDLVLKFVEDSQGIFLAVDEEEILPGRDYLARLGFYVEPTSAVVWPALHKIIKDLPEPVVTVLTGSGFKSSH